MAGGAADTWLMDSVDKRHIISSFSSSRSRGEDRQPWCQPGEPSSIPGREAAAAAGGQAGCPSPPRGAPRLFPLKWGLAEAPPERIWQLGTSAVRQPQNKRIGFPPSGTWLSRPSALPWKRSPAGKPRQSPVPPAQPHCPREMPPSPSPPLPSLPGKFSPSSWIQPLS